MILLNERKVFKSYILFSEQTYFFHRDYEKLYISLNISLIIHIQEWENMIYKSFIPRLKMGN